MRDIRVRLFTLTQEKGVKKGLIVVQDNGRGMNAKALEEWAQLHRPIDEREVTKKDYVNTDRVHSFRFDKDKAGSPLASFAFNPRGVSAPGLTSALRPVQPAASYYLTSNLSAFGAGSKLGLFSLGGVIKVISRPAGDPMVYEITIDEELMKERSAKKLNPYETTVVAREPGSAHLSRDWEKEFAAVFETFSGEELDPVFRHGACPGAGQEFAGAGRSIPADAGTWMVVGQLREDCLDLLHNNGKVRDLASQIADCNHSYIHGAAGKPYKGLGQPQGSRPELLGGPDPKERVLNIKVELLGLKPVRT